jgi:8-oxo-dGTP diphosphatase
MSEAVTWKRIPPMLEGIQLERVSGLVQMPLQYAGFSTETLLKIHLLPYLAPLKSERALAFELAERPELQSAVGLTSDRIPSRATLWHFRHRNAIAFRRLMIRSLVVMALDADRQKLPVPFAMKAHQDVSGSSLEDTFDDPRTGAKLTIYANPKPRQRYTERSLFLPLPGFVDSAHEEGKEKVWLHQFLHFPIFARWPRGPRTGFLSLIEPTWMDSPYTAQDLEPYLGKSGKSPYTACNILVVRKRDGREELLLSQRKLGSGAGTFGAPGGKKHEKESLLACVKRELWEEVGLEYRDGRPISVRKTRRRGFPRVVSVGVIATHWKGEPRRREHLAHSGWKWFALSNLPGPLFFPTQLAIDDYQNRSFENLDWDTIEPPKPFTLWSE